jgi:Protein of unknown function (DUF3489)
VEDAQFRRPFRAREAQAFHVGMTSGNLAPRCPRFPGGNARFMPRFPASKEILRATGWQAHSVRGFISGKLGKKMGLRVRSFQRDGERVYLIKG